jgi:microcin C transport system substrate-binding protein
VNRRTLLKSTIAALAAGQSLPRWTTPARAQEKIWRHGLSLFGDLKYPADFKHFD